MAKRRCKSDLANVHKSLKEGCKAACSNAASIISAVPSHRTQGKVQKSKYRRLPLNTGKYLFTVRGHWQKLPRVVEGFPFLEILRNHLDTVLDTLLQMTLLE